MIISYEEKFFMLYKGENGKLLLSVGADGAVISSCVLFSGAADDFCADVDKTGNIHVCVLSSKTLTYISRNKNGIVTSSHLTRLPEGCAITSLALCAGNEVRLYYCVCAHDEYSVVLYRKRATSWTASSICKSGEHVTLLHARKDRPCVIYKQQGASVRLISSDKGEIFSSNDDICMVQTLDTHTVFEAGGRIYDGGMLVASGSEPCLYPNGGVPMLVYKNNGELFRLVFQGAWCGQESYPCGSERVLYRYATPEYSLGYIISSRFPEIRLPVVRRNPTGNARLEEEVYFQQRTIFVMQAQLRALEARVARMESIKTKKEIVTDLKNEKNREFSSKQEKN